LENYLKNYENPKNTKKENSILGMEFAQNLEQVSYRKSPLPKVNVQHYFDYDGYTEKASKVLKDLDISGISMNQYIDRMKRWIYDQILKPLTDNVHEVNKKLKEFNYEGYDCNHPLDSSPSLGLFIPQNTPVIQSGRLTLRHILQHQAQGNLIVSNRIYLEEYLDIPNCNRKYLLERLESLSSGGYLPKFKWNSGGDFNGHSWNEKDFPTDSQIILHLFCKYFDLSLPSLPLHGKIFFTQRHFADQTVDEKRNTILLIHSRNWKNWNLHFSN
jgi:hypothetical protein